MQANYYDLLKYAATGQANPSMTGFDRMRALAMAGSGGGKIQTLTGEPPLTFTANGSPLESLTIYGNSNYQDHHATPYNPQGIGGFDGRPAYPDYTDHLIKVECGGVTKDIRIDLQRRIARIGHLILTGREEGWTLYQAPGVHQFYIGDLIASKPGLAGSSAAATNAGYGCTVFDRLLYDCGCYIVNGGLGIGFQMRGFENDFPDLNAWTSYLKGTTGMGFWYILANEEVQETSDNPLYKLDDYADELTIGAGEIPTTAGENTLSISQVKMQPSSVTITYK